MVKINTFKQYEITDNMLTNLAYKLSKTNELKETEDGENKDLVNKISKDLKVDLSELKQFKKSISVFLPVIECILSNVSNIENDEEVNILSTIATSFIICLEKEKNSNEEYLTKASRTLLEELKLRGVGNGMVKKIIKSLESIKNFISFIYSYMDKDIDNFNDLISIKGVSNVFKILSDIILEYKMSNEDIIMNFNNISSGVSLSISKENINSIIDSLEDIDKLNKSKISKDIESQDTDIKGFTTYYNDNEIPEGTEIIQEQ